MTNIDSGSKRLDKFDIEVNKNHTSAQITHVLDKYVGLPKKPALISRRYLKRQKRILSAYKNGHTGRTKQQQRNQKSANFSKDHSSHDHERKLSAKAAEPTDSVKNNVSTYKIRFQHQDCEQLENDTKDTKTSNTLIHDVALSRESSAGIGGVGGEEENYSPESTVSLPRLPEMQGSGVITKTLSGKLIRGLPGSKSSNWILVGSDGNHHLRQPTPVPPCFDPAFREMTRPGTLPPIQDSLTKMLDWGLRTNKLTLSALMQVDHKQACFRTDEIFDFGKELLLETQRAAAGKQDDDELANCLQETENQTLEKISGFELNTANSQENYDIHRSRDRNYTNTDESNDNEGNEEGNESQEESEEMEDDGDDIEHCCTLTVIVTPTPKSKAQRHQPDVMTPQPEPDVQSKKIQYKDQLAPKGMRQKKPILPSISRSTLPEGAGTTEPISKRVSSEGACSLPQIQRSASPTKASKVHRVSRTTLCSQSPILPRIPSRKTQDKSARNSIRLKQKRKQVVKSTVDDNYDDGCRSETAMSDDSTSGKDDREDTVYEETDTGIDLELNDKPSHDRSESQIRQRLLDRMEFECENDATNLFDDDKTLQRAVELRNLAIHPQQVSPPPSSPCSMYRNTDRQLGADDFGPEFGTWDNQQPGAGNFYIHDSYSSESSPHKSLMEQLKPSLYELKHLIDKNFSQLSNKLDDEISQCASDTSECLKPVSVRLVEVPAPKSKNPERSISDPTHDDNKGPEIKSVRFAELPPKRKPIERSKSDSTAPSDEWNDCFLVAIGKNRAIKKEIQHNQSRVPKSGSFNGVDGKSELADDDQFDAELIEREMKRYLHWLRHDRAVEQHRWFSANNVSHRHLPMTTHQVPQPLFAVNNQLTESSISAK